MIGTLRIIRWSALGLILLLALGAAVLEFAPDVLRRAIDDASGGTIALPAGVAIGGPFSLTDDQGRTVTDADYRGRWMLVYFGYTDCPDDCPLTLQKMAVALTRLGPLAEKLAPLFITVDPARDTPARLAAYLENFDRRIVGLTGSEAQIAAAAKAYRVYYAPAEHEKSGTDLVGHSTFLYLMDPAGRLDALLGADADADKLTATLRARLGTKPDARS